jgi:hypothetical protein
MTDPEASVAGADGEGEGGAEMDAAAGTSVTESLE